MKIKVTEENEKKIELELDAVQRRSRVRTIGIGDIFDVAANFENWLKENVFKKDQRGISCTIDIHAAEFPGKYNGTPSSTQFTLEVCASGMFITVIERGATKTPSLRTSLRIPEEKEKALADFHRKNAAF